MNRENNKTMKQLLSCRCTSIHNTTGHFIVAGKSQPCMCKLLKCIDASVLWGVEIISFKPNLCFCFLAGVSAEPMRFHNFHIIASSGKHVKIKQTKNNHLSRERCSACNFWGSPPPPGSMLILVSCSPPPLPPSNRREHDYSTQPTFSIALSLQHRTHEHL